MSVIRVGRVKRDTPHPIYEPLDWYITTKWLIPSAKKKYKNHFPSFLDFKYNSKYVKPLKNLKFEHFMSKTAAKFTYFDVKFSSFFRIFEFRKNPWVFWKNAWVSATIGLSFGILGLSFGVLSVKKACFSFMSFWASQMGLTFPKIWVVSFGNLFL